MRAIWFVGRAQLRRRWGGVVVLTLIMGIVGAVVIASTAGARRTATAFERFQDETLAPDLTVFIPEVDGATLAELRALPGVEAIGIGRQFMATINDERAAVGGPLDEDAFGVTVDRARVLRGRAPDQDRIGEIAIPESLVKVSGLDVGDRFVVHGFTQDQIDVALAGGDFDIVPQGPKVPIRVVGVTRVPGDLSLEGDNGGLILTTRAFAREYADDIGSFAGYVLRVRTTDGDAARRFVQASRALTAPLGQPGEFQVQPTSETVGAVQQSIDVVVSGLVVFAIVAALAGLVVVGVVLRRFVDGGASDLDTLRGLGLPRSSRVLALAVPIAPIAIVGPVVAVVGAVLASPIFPFGLGRRAEPNLGVDVDALVLALGFLAGAALIAGIGLIAARRVVSAAVPKGDRAPMRPSIATRVATNAGFAPAVTVGAGMATESARTRGAAAARPAVAGAVVAVFGVVAVAIVAASLGHLPDAPAAFGYNWDAHVFVNEPNRLDPSANCSPSRTLIADDPAVAAVADSCSDSIEVNGYSVNGVGLVPITGSIEPTVLEGRAPRNDHEIALGSDTMARINVGIGERVRAAGPGGQGSFRVVGRVAMPLLSAGQDDQGDTQAIADGAMFTGEGLGPLTDPGETPGSLLIRWVPGADIDAAKTRIGESLGEVRGVQRAIVPLEVDRLGQLGALPWLLGAFLGLIGILGLGYGVATLVRQRAREFAVLKTIGFRRNQVVVTIATQATAFGVVGLAIGIPLGLVVGRFAWDRVASGAGLATVTVIPVPVLVLVAIGSLLIVNVVAYIPGRRAARRPPAAVLRSE